jgi:hypothetical protein
MPATVVKITQFTGAGKVFTRDSDGLAAIVRGIAIDNARRVIESAGVPELTDNSTGTAAAAYAGAPLPVTAIDATVAGGANAADLNTSIGKQSNALQVLTNSANNALARLGLPVVSNAYGAQAAANTVPAQDLAGTAASGASAADFQSTVNALTVVRANFTVVAHAVNNVLAAIGENRLSRSAYGPEPQNSIVAAVPTVVASAAGPSSAALADVTAFLDGLADDIATLALAWNSEILGAPTVTAITDSTGGTAAAALAVDATPAPATGAATTSAPKAGFDAQLVLLNNACASLAAKANVLLDEYELPALTNSTGGTVSNTLAAESVALVAVDGSSGVVAVDVVTAAARMATVENNLSSISARLAVLAPYFGVPGPGVDALGGTVSGTIAPVAATAAGVTGVNATMLNSAVNSWLTTNRNNVSTLAAILNTMIGANAPAVGLHVVAG